MTTQWNDSQPIYWQLKERTIAMILDGTLAEGEALPSVRTVASDFQLNPITVSKSYQARSLVTTLGDGEQVLFALATLLLPAVLAGIMVSAILSAIMSTADSQLLVAASSVSHDMRNGEAPSRKALQLARWVVLLIGIAAVMLAVYSPEAIFSRVLFAWQALAAAFGPLLVVTLWRGPVAPNWRIAAMVTGFTLTVIISWTTETPGDIAERYIPMLIALAMAWHGSKKSS